MSDWCAFTFTAHTRADLDLRSTPAQSPSSAKSGRDQTRAPSEQEPPSGNKCSAGTLTPGGAGGNDGPGTEAVDRLEPLAAPALDPTSTPFEPRVSVSEGPCASGNWALAEAGELDDIGTQADRAPEPDTSLSTPARGLPTEDSPETGRTEPTSVQSNVHGTGLGSQTERVEPNRLMDSGDSTGPKGELLQNLSATVGTVEVIPVQLGLPVPCCAWSSVLSPAVNLESAVLLTDAANLPPGRAGVNPDSPPGTIWHTS
eukprot:3052633-Rhodomonas_salina.1